MTNFDKFKKDMTKDFFIDIMLMYCDECPVTNCELRDTSVYCEECSEILKKWCDENASDEQVAVGSPMMVRCKDCQHKIWLMKDIICRNGHGINRPDFACTDGLPENKIEEQEKK